MIQGHIHSHHNPKLSQYDPEHPFIPLSMFLMLPSTQDDYYIGEGKSIRRFLFQGTAHETYTPFELQQYKQFEKYWQANKHKLPANIVNNKFWNYPWRLRWLTSEQFDIKNTIKAMEMHTTYLGTNLKNVTPSAQKILKTGVFYVSGRDAYMRPILVFDIDKMIKSKMTEQQLLQSQKFFFQKVLNQYLLPGQVQTWVAIIDVGFQNLLSLISPLKASIGFLSNTFRNRMRVCYVVRIPGSLSFLWRIIKNFLKQDTASKINFIDQQQVAPLLKYTNPTQLQAKYGGTQPQIAQFWPPRTVKKLQQLKLVNFSHRQVVSIPISQEAYKTKYEKKKLQGHIICNILIQDQKKKEIQELNKTQQKFKQQQIKNEEKINKKNIVSNQLYVSSQKISWPTQYKPLAAPIIKSQDIIIWEKLLI